MPLLLFAVIALALLAGGAVVLDRGSKEGFVRSLDQALAAAGLERATRELVIAHAALEVGWGRTSAASVNNLWNLTAGSSWTGPTIPGPDTEYNAAGEVKNITQQWRAYNNLGEAIGDYLAFLGSPRYRDAKRELLAGDVNWVQTLGADGYYTLPVDQYAERYGAVLDQVRGYLPEV